MSNEAFQGKTKSESLDWEDGEREMISIQGNHRLQPLEDRFFLKPNSDLIRRQSFYD